MIFTPNDLRDFLATTKAQMAEINHVVPVIDDSQMATQLNEVAVADNLVIIGVLPDYTGSSRGDDALTMDNQLEFIIIKKMEYADYNHDEFIDVMQETLLATRKLVDEIYKHRNGVYGNCSPMQQLVVGSERIGPVWHKAGCNGYSLSVNLETQL